MKQANGARRTGHDRGSFNYTGPANTLNDGNIFIIGDLDAPITAAQTNNQRQIGKYALDETDRIIEVFGVGVESD